MTDIASPVFLVFPPLSLFSVLCVLQFFANFLPAGAMTTPMTTSLMGPQRDRGAVVQQLNRVIPVDVSVRLLIDGVLHNRSI